MPVCTTTHSALPDTTVVHAKSILVISAMTTVCGTVSMVLLIVVLSPVSTDSSANRETALVNLISAFTLSHASKKTISPGTISLAGTMYSLSPLNTLIMGDVSCLSKAIDLSALYSWINHKIALRTTMAAITVASTYSCKTMLNATAHNNMITSGSVN